ncbi:MAG TPA: nuclear transport factor 2 family protein [Solirubrobacteraceae bacterium]|jgi:hypothetical protein|nr:nuclear transport factor 2 family protein [Solirubrobacteraceae bacterium]
MDEPTKEPARVEQLLSRLELLEAERAILRRLHAYGHATDRADAEGFADCFTANGVCDVQDPSGGPVERRVVGRAALVALIEGFARPPASRHRHLLIEPVIDLAPTLDSATATSYFAVLREHEGTPCVWAFGRYLDELVREGDGDWRFARRTAALDSVDASQPPLAEGSPE